MLLEGCDPDLPHIRNHHEKQTETNRSIHSAVVFFTKNMNMVLQHSNKTLEYKKKQVEYKKKQVVMVVAHPICAAEFQIGAPQP
jgi:hypothetical protein